jgi:hypothetical protein
MCCAHIGFHLHCCRGGAEGAGAGPGGLAAGGRAARRRGRGGRVEAARHRDGLRDLPHGRRRRGNVPAGGAGRAAGRAVERAGGAGQRPEAGGTVHCSVARVPIFHLLAAASLPAAPPLHCLPPPLALLLLQHCGVLAVDNAGPRCSAKPVELDADRPSASVPSPLQVMPKFVPGPNVARVDLVPQWDTQHNSPAQSLTADVPYHELARRCVALRAVTVHIETEMTHLPWQPCSLFLMSRPDIQCPETQCHGRPGSQNC